MVDFSNLSQKIFQANPRIRGVTFARFDGEVLHFEMRSGIESLNPPGEIGKMDAEVLVPALNSYFDAHKNYFGDINYMGAKFDKVSLAYIKHKNIFLIMSVQPRINLFPIVRKIKKILDEEL